MNCRLGLTRLPLHEAEDVRVLRLVVQQHTTEGAGVPLEQLLLGSLDEVQLNVSVDSLTPIGSRYSEEGAPLTIRREHISDNLSFLEVSCSFKDFDLLLLRFGNADMIDGCCGDDS